MILLFHLDSAVPASRLLFLLRLLQLSWIPAFETVSQLPFLSFRASEARHGIQYFQQVLDAGFRRHDGVDSTFYYYDTVSSRG